MIVRIAVICTAVLVFAAIVFPTPPSHGITSESLVKPVTASDQMPHSPLIVVAESCLSKCKADFGKCKGRCIGGSMTGCKFSCNQKYAACKKAC